jgi:hypothetical protein
MVAPEVVPLLLSSNKRKLHLGVNSPADAEECGREKNREACPQADLPGST